MTNKQVDSKIASINNNSNILNNKDNSFLENNKSSTSNISHVESLKYSYSEIADISILESPITKSTKVNKISHKKFLKTSEILFIDLTNDSSNGKVIKKIKKPFWLQDLEKETTQKNLSDLKICSRNITLKNSLEDTFKLLSIKKDVALVNESASRPLLEDDKNLDISIEDTITRMTSTSPKNDESESLTMEINGNPSSQIIPNNSSADAVLGICEITKSKSDSNNKNSEILSIAESQCNVKNENTRSVNDKLKTDLDTTHKKLDHTECSFSEVNNRSEDEKNESKNSNNELGENITASNKEINAKSDDDGSKIDRPLIFSEDKAEESKDHQDVRCVIQESENIDGLILLASVSQKVAPIKIDSCSNDLIKVKNYSDMKKLNNEKALTLPENTQTETLSEVLNICPEATFEIEVSSSNENANYMELNDVQNNLVFGNDNTNVILNGETVVLLQKFPNSNLYIINKAVENKVNNGDEEINDLVAREELSDHSENLDRVKVEMENEDMKSNLENLKKCTSYTCRQEIKHDYQVKNFGMQKYPSMLPHDLVDSQMTLTMPTIYANFSTSSELCMSCHKHCNSMPYGLNPPKANTSHCGPCSSCTCEVVAHCRQCILPANESRTSFIENNSYYLPSQSSVIPRTNSEVMMMDLYDDQLFRKIENGILEGKTLDKVDINYQNEMNRHNDRTSKLPLKKRLKSHMITVAYDNLNIKMKGEFQTSPLNSNMHVDKLIEPSIQNITESVEMDVPIKNKSTKNTPKITKEKGPKKRKSSKVDYSCLKQDYEWNSSEMQSKDNYRKRNTSDMYSCSKSCDQTNKLPVQEKSTKEIVKNDKTSKIFRVNYCRNSWNTTEPVATETKYGEWKNTSRGKKEIAQEKPTKGIRGSERASKRKIPKINYTYPEYSEIEWNSSSTTKRRRKTTR